MKTLTRYQKTIIKQMQERDCCILVSRFSDNTTIEGTVQSVIDSTVDNLLDAGIIEYTRESDIHNYYGLTAVGKKLGL